MVDAVEACLRTVNTYGREDARLPEDVIRERARNIVCALMVEFEVDEDGTTLPPVAYVREPVG